MIKIDFVRKIAEATNLTQEESKIVLEKFLTEIKQALAKGEKVEIRGLGTFEVRKRASRPARNIITGETIILPQRKIPYFKPGKILKLIVNN